MNFLATERSDGVVTLTLNRPERMNALGPELCGELSDELRRLQDSDDVRAVVITGAGRAFCSGADLSGYTSIPSPGEVRRMLDEELSQVVRLIRALPSPVVAAVNGVAAGAGCSIALAADYLIMADNAKFQFLFSGIGLVPDVGASFFLPQAIGRQRALELFMTGRPVEADEAEHWGLVNRVVPASELATVSQMVATGLSRKATRALVLARRLIDASANRGLEEQLALEAEYQEIAAGTEDFKRAVAAFKTKMMPEFTGR